VSFFAIFRVMKSLWLCFSALVSHCLSEDLDLPLCMLGFFSAV